MNDPTIEEVRTQLEELLAEAESDRERRGDDPELSKAERFSAGEVWALQKALKMMQPKPLSPEVTIDQAIADPNRIPVLEVQLHTRDGWRRRSVKELREAILINLRSEGYSIHYDGKPVAPSLNPVVDTGESLKVQLAKQINVLAKLLAEEGCDFEQFKNELRLLDSEMCSKGLLPFDGKTDPANAFAVSFTDLYRRERRALTDILTVLRAQFILSTDIGQAIDRLNELVSLVHESEEK